MTHQVSVLVIAKPGQLRDGLQTLLKALPEVAHVRHADDGPAALIMNAGYAPALIVFDCDLPQPEVVTTLRQIKARWPRTPCIALVDTEHDHQAVQAAGADMLLLKGILAARIFTTIAELLARQKA